MDIEYLYSIVDLYLKNEDEHNKVNLNIQKKHEDIVFSFTMRKDNPDKTSIKIPLEKFNKHWYTFLNKYKGELLIIDEKYDYDKVKDTCYYYVLFKNGRIISFNDFSIMEINNLRNCLYQIRYNQEEIRVNLDDHKEMAYQPRLNLQTAGFSSYKTLFFVTIFLLDVFFISLWICKLLMK